MLVSHIKPIFREMWDIADLPQRRYAADRSASSVPATSDPGYNDLDRSEAQWRDLRLSIPKRLLRAITTLPFVISTGAKRSGEICVCRSLNVCCGP